MRVLLITVRSDFGGGPRHVNQLIDCLPSDVELYMAFPEEGDPYSKQWISNERIKGICYVPYRKLSLKTLFRLQAFVKENHIDIIHSHGNGAGYYSRLLKLIGCKAKIIHTFHGITDNYSSWAKKLANRYIGVFFRGLTDAFVLVSNGEKELGEKLSVLRSKDSHVIYNGIEDPKKQSHSTDFNIITLSRFDYQKNMDRALDIARLLKSESGIKFIWVGDGSDYERLKGQAKDEGLNISFVGFSTEPMHYLLNSSIYLSTSRFEGLPYALIEAGSVGLPIIATDVVGNNEVVKNGYNGYLYEDNDSAIDQIKHLYESEQDYLTMKENSYQYFKEKFTVEQMISEIDSLYKKILYDKET